MCNPTFDSHIYIYIYKKKYCWERSLVRRLTVIERLVYQLLDEGYFGKLKKKSTNSNKI